ncbi:hypothetical protein [Pleurocapsa sp. PCC 7319]|uniref:hypothetical protein n=1 Tax=Pleurocapsa sp. PCC 7319 TaxID=118161 RepID=UPI00034C9BC7|nr:hypothetical protein [Pleurocapsa sp. PCC 7319]
MTGKNTWLTTENSTPKEFLDQSNSEFSLNDLVWRKVDNFKHNQILEVLDICQKYNELDVNTFVVRSQENLTIWIEETSKLPSSHNNPNTKVNKDQTVLQTPQSISTKTVVKDFQPIPTQTVRQNSQSIPTEKVTRKYRGQMYEEEQLASNHDSIPTKTEIKKYRGKLYEEEIIDWTKMQPPSPQNKPRRKYRGHYID